MPIRLLWRPVTTICCNGMAVLEAAVATPGLLDSVGVGLGLGVGVGLGLIWLDALLAVTMIQTSKNNTTGRLLAGRQKERWLIFTGGRQLERGVRCHDYKNRVTPPR
jgi:hypothetical protein